MGSSLGKVFLPCSAFLNCLYFFVWRQGLLRFPLVIFRQPCWRDSMAVTPDSSLALWFAVSSPSLLQGSPSLRLRSRVFDVYTGLGSTALHFDRLWLSFLFLSPQDLSFYFLKNSLLNHTMDLLTCEPRPLVWGDREREGGRETC